MSDQEKQAIVKHEGSLVHDGAFESAQGFENAQRMARALASSTMVPAQYQGNLPNCIIALEMAQRMGMNPIAIMQNMYVVHGNPSWSAQFLIASFNRSGRFRALRYEFTGDERADDWGCRAWTIEKDTGDRLDGTWVTIGLAKKEGWYNKKGSKWLTMPQQMLMYRAASWFIRAYAPEIAMGLMTQEEAIDIGDITPPEPPESLTIPEDQAERVNTRLSKLTGNTGESEAEDENIVDTEAVEVDSETGEVIEETESEALL